MPTPLPVPFGRALRVLRAQQDVSQETLSHLSGVSVRQISSLESGEARWPRKDTIRQLADALELEGLTRQKFGEAARGRVAASASVPADAGGATRILPRDTSSFIGRDDQMSELEAQATGQERGIVAICAIDGMPGVGKTAFAIHAAHQLTPLFVDGHMYLSLAGQRPGRAPMRPTDALASLLLATGMAAKQIPSRHEARAELWHAWLADRRLLLLLDDAADSDHVVPLLPQSGIAMVIVTSRRRLTALEDARTMTLESLPAGQAAHLFITQAGRPRLNDGDSQVATICRLCGCLPLAVSMLGRLLHHHPNWSPADLVRDLSQQRDRLEIMVTENLSVAAAFDVSYQRLSVGQQQMFRHLALHPGSDIDVYAAAALNGSPVVRERRQLTALYDQHLIAEPAHGRYRLHDLTREYAGSLGRNEDAETESDHACNRLLDYYQRAAETADRQLSPFTRPQRPSPMVARVPVVPDMPDALAALFWLRAERANMVACIALASRNNALARVVALTAAMATLLRIDGPWASAIAYHRAAARAAAEIGDPLRQADALHDLGVILRMSGDYRTADRDLTAALERYRQHADELGAANTLVSLSTLHRLSGDYGASAGAADEALDAYRRLDDWRGLVSALTNLGIVRYFTGRTGDSMAVLQEALGLTRGAGDQRAEASVLAHQGVANRLAGRYEVSSAALGAAALILDGTGQRLEEANTLTHLAMTQQAMGRYAETLTALDRALAIYRDLGDRLGQGNTLTLLGPALHHAGDARASFEALVQAQRILQDLPDQMGEANAWYYLGRLHRQSDHHAESEDALQRALSLYRSIEVPGGVAVVLNELGTLHRLEGSVGQAESDHRKALELADETGSDGDRAEALVGLGRCSLAVGRSDEAREYFEQGLGILRRIKAPEAAEIEAELTELGPD